MAVVSMSKREFDRLEVLTVLAILGVAYGLVTAFAALLPCLVAENFAALLRARPAWYFALWGAVTGLALGPCVSALHRGFVTDSGPPLPALWADRYAMELPSTGPLFALSGAMGGLAYWWLSSRRAAATPSRGLS